LELFGITDLSQLNFVSDRGSNFMKALKPYSPVYCVAHRLNNIIKTCFYQTAIIKRKNVDNIPNEVFQLVYSSDSDDGNDDYDRSAVVAASFNYDLVNVDLMNLPSSASNILTTISFCKALSGLNKIIQNQGGVAVLQATTVRWLSMVQLLESINRSYKQIKKILADREKTVFLDKLIILQLIFLLRPFKHVILIIQKGKEPTLHLVTIAIITLRDAFNTHQALMEFSQNYEINSSTQELDDDAEYFEENEGLKF
ncbi:unnamed protein product, partial [Rotaria sp. Silwood1]